MKILHILDHYKPHFSGYVFRTSYILKHQRDLGLQLALVTSPKQGPVKAGVDDIDDMKVYRTLKTEFGSTPFIREVKLMNTLQDRIEDAIRIEQPDVIHAHSPSLNGMAALKAGRNFGVPVVYEVRAFWEDAAVDHGTFEERSFKYKMSRFLETRLFSNVDALFTICEGLKREMESRGIPGGKISIVPNCVDLEKFSPEGYSADVASRYGLRGKQVYGFIGSFYQYEGLDLLIEGYRTVLEKNNDTRLFLVGDGPEKQSLHDKVQKMGLQEQVIFAGKVPHEDIKEYYSVIDILIYPRKSMRLTELVTPLKPLEAMALGKIVVGSDVGGIRELITHNKDGFLFKAGDGKKLTELLIGLADKRTVYKKTGKAAMETVKNKHDWKEAVKRYVPVYESLLKKYTRSKVCYV